MSTTPRQGELERLQPQAEWKSVLESAATEVAAMMAGLSLKPSEDQTVEASGAVTAMVGMAGALCGVAKVRCSKRGAETIARGMTGESVLSQEAIADAMGELCNMIAGDFKSRIPGLSENCMLSVPTVIRGEDYVMQVSEPAQQLQIVFDLAGEPLFISLTLHS